MLLFREIFNRYEFKYLMTREVFHKLLGGMQAYTIYDEYGDNNGQYTISSIYFDNSARQCYYDTLNRQPFRQKLRLRVYNSCRCEDNAFFEIKLKWEGMVRKRRVKMKLKDAETFIESCRGSDAGIIDNFTASNKQILREIYFLLKSQELTPMAVVSYDRIALAGTEDPELRITFDSNIRSRDYDLRLESGSFGERTTDRDLIIMEVKTNKNIPAWLADLISEYGCVNKSFSKYCSHYNKGEEQNGFECIERDFVEIGSY